MLSSMKSHDLDRAGTPSRQLPAAALWLLGGLIAAGLVGASWMLTPDPLKAVSAVGVVGVLLGSVLIWRYFASSDDFDLEVNPRH